jgi:hypothetical protein
MLAPPFTYLLDKNRMWLRKNPGRRKNLPGLLLQGEIFGLILVKIQCLGSWWDTLGGVIGEFAALFAGNDAFFDAEDLILFQFGSVDAVSAGLFNLFLKQHTDSSIFFLYYTPIAGKILLLFFCLRRNLTPSHSTASRSGAINEKKANCSDDAKTKL